MPPNGAHDAYAIWLRDRQSGAATLVGYVQTKVTKSGSLSAQGQLPGRASRYDQILVTREFEAPPHLVFKAWTTPELVKRWWHARTVTG